MKTEWTLLGIAFVVLVASVFMRTSREGFETAKCPDGSAPGGADNKCIGPTVYDTTCPAGSTKSGKACRSSNGAPLFPNCPPNTEHNIEIDKCVTRVPPTCPGGTLMNIRDRPKYNGQYCVPSGTDIFTVSAEDQRAAQVETQRLYSANPNDPKIDSEYSLRLCKKPGYTYGQDAPGGYQLPTKCISTSTTTKSVTTASPTAPSTTAPPLSFDNLNVKYKGQSTDYDALVKDAIARQDESAIPKIKTANEAISQTLNDMIAQITFMKKDTPVILAERDRLVKELRQIQKDYNGLLATTDQLETLRRIRQEEGSEYKKQLYWYLIAFFAVCLLILLAMLFFQKTEATAAIASTVPSTAPLV